MRRPSHFLASIARLAGLVALAASPSSASAQTQPHAGGMPSLTLLRAHDAILRLDVAEAKALLEGVSTDDPAAAVEHALLAVYEGDCDRAVSLLKQPVAVGQQGSGPLAEIARGCSRVTASTAWVKDDARGVWLRFKDEDDAALAPLLAEVAVRALDALDRDIGVRLPRPLKIEVVRDQYSLAQMTGLPEEAAQTTGTVAVAKWGRVTMLTPHASPHGYAWADTLMHELTHLSVTRASHDRAPLWLQEGTAKREEVRWRPPGPFDDLPSPDAIAKLGFEHGLGLPLDKLGPSIAMLPTPEQAMVAFAEVNSFLRYWVRESGEGSLAKLLRGLADARGDNPVDAALASISGAGLGEWSDRWQRQLAQVPMSIPPDLMPTFPRGTGHDKAQAPPPSPQADGGARDIYKNARLGELLAGRGHHEPAAGYFRKTVAAAPYDPSARARLALSLRALGREDEAARVVETIEAVHSAHAVYFTMRGASQRGRGDTAAAEESFHDALLISPFDAVVACQGLEPGKTPAGPVEAALCELARRR